MSPRPRPPESRSNCVVDPADPLVSGFVLQSPRWYSTLTVRNACSLPSMRQAPGTDGVAIDVQRTMAARGGVMFYVNVGVLLPVPAVLPRRRDPLRGAMPHHDVWDHRLDAIPDASSHTFWLSVDEDVDRAGAVVRTWLAVNLPRLKSWLGDYDAMLAAIEADRERAGWARR